VNIRILCLAGAMLGWSLSSAFAEESDASKPLQLRQWDNADGTVGAEAPLGSDAWRVQRLAQSPRPHEMIAIPGGTRKLQAFVVYPSTKDKVPVVLLAPEDQGIGNWAREMADQIAAMGYIVIAPDFLSGYGPGGGGRSTFPDLKSIFQAHSALPAHEDSMTGDLNAWADYGKKMAQSNGKLAVAGFAWGAGRAFWFATQRKDLNAVYIFYDWSPPAAALAGITAPVYGFYAETDTRVQKSIDATKAAMAAAGKKYEAITYPGADHMFVRLGEEAGNTNPANIEARAQSLARLQDLLKKL
jgi:carboxymethylenebutenolidase